MYLYIYLYRSINSSIYLCMYTYITICLMYPSQFNYLSINHSIYPSIYPSILQSIYIFMHLSIYLSIYLNIFLLIHQFIHITTYLYIDPFIHLRVYQSMFLSIYLSIHSSMCLQFHLIICHNFLLLSNVFPVLSYFFLFTRPLHMSSLPYHLTLPFPILLLFIYHFPNYSNCFLYPLFSLYLLFS